MVYFLCFLWIFGSNSVLSEKKQFGDLLEPFNITQHVEGPTHSRGHTLDLVMSRTDDDTVASCSTSHFVSDHNAVLIRLNTGQAHLPQKKVTYRKLQPPRPLHVQMISHHLCFLLLYPFFSIYMELGTCVS